MKMKKTLSAAFLIILLAFSILPNSLSAASGSREYQNANKLFGEGRFPEAIQAYQQVLSATSRNIPLHIVHTRIADSYFRMDDYAQALGSYQAALNAQKPSERAPTQYWIGFCTFLLGRDAQAVIEFLKIPEQYPSSGMWVGTGYYWAARASERMGNKHQAAEFYGKAAGNGKSTQERFALKKAAAVKSSK